MGHSMNVKNCERCGGDTNGDTTMSMYNTEVICMKCKEDEKNRPDYNKAVEADIAEIKKGNYNFPGIGFPISEDAVILALIAKGYGSARAINLLESHKDIYDANSTGGTAKQIADDIDEAEMQMEKGGGVSNISDKRGVDADGIKDYKSLKRALILLAQQSKDKDDFVQRVSTFLPGGFGGKYFPQIRRDIFGVSDSEWVGWQSSRPMPKFEKMGELNRGSLYDKLLLLKMANGGGVEKPEEKIYSNIISFEGNLMGTISFVMKIAGMKKPQDFIVYAISKDDTSNLITIQSDTRIGKISLDSGKGLMSQSHSSGAYFHHLSLDKKTPFILSENSLAELRQKIRGTAGSSVGTAGVTSDNSGASLLAKGGSFARGGEVDYPIVNLIGDDTNYYVVRDLGDLYEVVIDEKLDLFERNKNNPNRELYAEFVPKSEFDKYIPVDEVYEMEMANGGAVAQTYTEQDYKQAEIVISNEMANSQIPYVPHNQRKRFIIPLAVIIHSLSEQGILPQNYKQHDEFSSYVSSLKDEVEMQALYKEKNKYGFGGGFTNVIGDKKAREIIRYVIASAQERGMSLPALSKFIEEGAKPGVLLEAYKEFEYAVNNGGNANFIRLPYEDSNRFRDYVKSHLPNLTQREMYDFYGKEPIRESFPSYAKGGGIEVSLKYPEAPAIEVEFEKGDPESYFMKDDRWKVRYGNLSQPFLTKKEAEAEKTRLSSFKSWRDKIVDDVKKQYAWMSEGAGGYKPFMPGVKPQALPNLNNKKEYGSFTLTPNDLKLVPRGTYFKFKHFNAGVGRTMEFVFDEVVEDRILGWNKFDNEWKWGDYIFFDYDDTRNSLCTGSGSEILFPIKIVYPPNNFKLPDGGGQA